VDGRSVFAEVMSEAGRLGLRPLERIALIIAVALVVVMGKRGLAVLSRLELKPQIVADENGPQPPGVELELGEPGGGPTGGMG
jgi:hypothetical protein